MRPLLLLSALLFCLPAAAESCPEQVKQGFIRRNSDFTFGYFMPGTPVERGVYKLNHISFGGDEEFAAFAKGERMDSYAPLMISFDDTSSEQVQNELGGSGYARTIRVLPDAYCLIGDQLRFRGHDKDLGIVTLSAQVSDSGLMLAGTMTIGPKTFDPVNLEYFAGD